jgi:hypothetical protein
MASIGLHLDFIAWQAKDRKSASMDNAIRPWTTPCRQVGWPICWQAGIPDQPGFTPAVYCPNRVISVFFNNSK